MIFVLILASIIIAAVLGSIVRDGADYACDKTQCNTCPYRCDEKDI